MPALSAMRHNPVVAALATRLKAQGRLKGKQIAVAAMRKLIPGATAADGTLLNLDSAMSPLLQAAQQAVIEEQQKQLPPPTAKMVEPVEVEAVEEKPSAAEIFSPHEPEKPLAAKALPEVEPVKAVIEPVTPVSPVQEPDLPRGVRARIALADDFSRCLSPTGTPMNYGSLNLAGL